MAGDMHRIAPLTVVLALVIGLGGCSSGPADSVHPNQRYALKDVKKRLKDVEPGMTKMEVMIHLGSPAQISRNTWIYMPSRSGILLPSQALHVNFVNGVYVSHETKAIILGEQIGG